jgi:adenylylsulfate kinase
MTADITTSRGLTVWLTGLPASGKSTLAQALQERFREVKHNVEVLDGDAIRRTISNDLGFSREDRDENVRRIGNIAGLLASNGVTVIVAAVSPYRAARDLNRHDIENYLEVYCRCPLEVAETRDPKGIYRRARAGELRHVTGIDDPYEEPLHPEVIVDTDKETVIESLENIWAALRSRGYV